MTQWTTWPAARRPRSLGGKLSISFESDGGSPFGGEEGESAEVSYGADGGAIGRSRTDGSRRREGNRDGIIGPIYSLGLASNLF